MRAGHDTPPTNQALPTGNQVGPAPPPMHQRLSAPVAMERGPPTLHIHVPATSTMGSCSPALLEADTLIWYGPVQMLSTVPGEVVKSDVRPLPGRRAGGRTQIQGNVLPFESVPD